jgi:putative membrane protein
VVYVFWDHYGMGWGWSWVWILLPILLIVAAVVVVIVVLANRSTGASHHPGPVPPEYRAPSHTGNARMIAAERLARGEITPEEYREIVRALDETPGAPPGA